MVFTNVAARGHCDAAQAMREDVGAAIDSVLGWAADQVVGTASRPEYHEHAQGLYHAASMIGRFIDPGVRNWPTFVEWRDMLVAAARRP